MFAIVAHGLSPDARRRKEYVLVMSRIAELNFSDIAWPRGATNQCLVPPWPQMQHFCWAEIGNRSNEDKDMPSLSLLTIWSDWYTVICKQHRTAVWRAQMASVLDRMDTKLNKTREPRSTRWKDLTYFIDENECSYRRSTICSQEWRTFLGLLDWCQTTIRFHYRYRVIRVLNIRLNSWISSIGMWVRYIDHWWDVILPSPAKMSKCRALYSRETEREWKFDLAISHESWLNLAHCSLLVEKQQTVSFPCADVFFSLIERRWESGSLTLLEFRHEEPLFKKNKKIFSVYTDAMLWIWTGVI